MTAVVKTFERPRVVHRLIGSIRRHYPDFFSRARGILTIVTNEDLQVLHARTPFDSDYMRFRHDTRRYQVIFNAIYGQRRRSTR